MAFSYLFPVNFRDSLPGDQPSLSPKYINFYPKWVKPKGIRDILRVCGGELLPAGGEIPVVFQNITVLFRRGDFCETHAFPMNQGVVELRPPKAPLARQQDYGASPFLRDEGIRGLSKSTRAPAN
jgi:hypothetical protein